MIEKTEDEQRDKIFSKICSKILDHEKYRLRKCVICHKHIWFWQPLSFTFKPREKDIISEDIDSVITFNHRHSRCERKHLDDDEKEQLK